MSWPEDPRRWLAGRRGGRRCWGLAAEMHGPTGPAIGPAWKRVWSHSRGADPVELASELAAAVAGTDWHLALAGMSQVDLVEPLAESVTVAMYLQGPDEVDRGLAPPEVAGGLGPGAPGIAHSPAPPWWSTGSRPGPQHIGESAF